MLIIDYVFVFLSVVDCTHLEGGNLIKNKYVTVLWVASCYQEDGWSKPAFKATTYTIPYTLHIQMYIYTTLSVLWES